MEVIGFTRNSAHMMHGSPWGKSHKQTCILKHGRTLKPHVQHEPAPTFRSFAKLPIELRLRIWTLSLPTSRVVPVRCGLDPPNGDYPEHNPRGLTTGCMSSAPIPGVLHACMESRQVGLVYYNFFFGFARCPGQVVFRPDADILFFGPRPGYMAADAQFRTFMSLCSTQDLAAVRRVAISDALFWTGPEYRSMTAGAASVDVLRQLCARMPALEELIFVPRDEDNLLDGDEAVFERMTQQIQTSMRTVSQQVPQWHSPVWRIERLQGLDGLRI